MKLQTLCSFLFVLLAPVSVAFAQDSAPAPLTLIADVNIENTRVVEQVDNAFKIGFTIHNGVGVQTGVRYGVVLADKGEKQLIVDEKVYDESLTLRAQSSVQKEIFYTAPAVLQGSFMLYVVSYNENGFPFGLSSAGEVALSAREKGLVLDTATCSAESGDRSVPVEQPITISPTDTLSLTCSVKNTAPTPLVAVPFFETRYRSAFGETLAPTGGSTSVFSFAAGETRTVMLELPTMHKPQLYHIRAGLSVSGVHTNAVSFRYNTSGPRATIENVSFDAEGYRKGDTATMKVIWGGSAENMRISATLTNASGRHCAEPLTRAMTAGERPQASLVIALTSFCENPTVAVSLLDGTGTVLDEKQFTVASALKPTRTKTLVGIAVSLVVVLAAAYAMVRKKRAASDSVGTLALALSVSLSGALLFGTYAHAATYTVGVNGDIRATVNLQTGTIYSPGAQIIADARLENVDATGWGVTYPTYLNAVNNGGSLVSLIPNTTLAPNQSVYGSGSFRAPTAPNAYPMQFFAWVDEPEAQVGFLIGATTDPSRFKITRAYLNGSQLYGAFPITSGQPEEVITIPAGSNLNLTVRLEETITSNPSATAGYLNVRDVYGSTSTPLFCTPIPSPGSPASDYGWVFDLAVGHRARVSVDAGCL